MGDRANVVVLDNGPVFLYSHWGGHELPETVREALAREERWDDPAYLARIVFCQMVGDDTGETGFGISTTPPDNEYDLIVLHEERVYRVPFSTYREHRFADGVGEAPSLSFADYINVGSRTWENLLDPA